MVFFFPCSIAMGGELLELKGSKVLRERDKKKTTGRERKVFGCS